MDGKKYAGISHPSPWRREVSAAADGDPDYSTSYCLKHQPCWRRANPWLERLQPPHLLPTSRTLQFTPIPLRQLTGQYLLMEPAQQSSDQSKRAAFPRAEDAIVPDLHKALWQDMLQEAADEFLGTQCAEAGFSAAGIPVGKGDLAVSKSADAPVAQRHAKDVGSQILERRHTAVHRLAVDHPVLDPDFRRYFLK